MELFIRSRNVVTPEGMRDALVHVRNGSIESVSVGGDAPEGASCLDVSPLVLMPGLVDTHVHINEPGRTSWEGFESATRAAAAGGITTLIDMPLNSSPVTTTLDAFRRKASAAEGKLSVDVGFHAGIIPGNAGELPGLADAGVFGAKAFLIDSGIEEFPASGERDLREAMASLAGRGVPVLVHCELSPDDAPPSGGDVRSYRRYLASRPRSWEADAIAMMISLCREFRCPTHIVHLSSADAVPALRAARASGLPLTVETCPHYLVFCAEDIPDGDTRFKCAPPIRERENRERLWDALKEGVIDGIVSDHSPAPPAMKETESGDLVKAWGGIASLQFGLPVVWTEARRRGFSLNDVAEWMSAFPARLAGLGNRKGRIAPGFDADLIVWDPDAPVAVAPESTLHRHPMTPYAGRRISGSVHTTYLRGVPVYGLGRFPGEPRGRLIARNAAVNARQEGENAHERRP